MSGTQGWDSIMDLDFVLELPADHVQTMRDDLLRIGVPDHHIRVVEPRGKMPKTNKLSPRQVIVDEESANRTDKVCISAKYVGEMRQLPPRKIDIKMYKCIESIKIYRFLGSTFKSTKILFCFNNIFKIQCHYHYFNIILFKHTSIKVDIITSIKDFSFSKLPFLSKQIQLHKQIA